jgi:hypothetical protein
MAFGGHLGRTTAHLETAAIVAAGLRDDGGDRFR